MNFSWFVVNYCLEQIVNFAGYNYIIVLNIVSQIFTLTKKEFLIEFRSKNTLFAMLLYVFGIALILYLSFVLKTNKIAGVTWNALFWVNLFFVSQLTIGKSFFGEARGRDFYYGVVAKPEAVIISKIIYGAIVLLVLSLLSFVIFSNIFNQEIGSVKWFLVNLFAGSLALSSGQSFLAAVASKANNNSTLLTILSIPVIAPLILFLIRISNNAIDDISAEIIIRDLIALGCINIVIIAVSYVLFPYLWRS